MNRHFLILFRSSIDFVKAANREGREDFQSKADDLVIGKASQGIYNVCHYVNHTLEAKKFF